MGLLIHGIINQLIVGGAAQAAGILGDDLWFAKRADEYYTNVYSEYGVSGHFKNRFIGGSFFLIISGLCKG